MAQTPTAEKTSRDRFLRLLRNNILKLDLADLDFGIYRVLNYRRAEIEEFLTDRLPMLIDAVLTKEGEARLEQARAELATLKDELERSASGLGLPKAFPDGALDDRLRSSPRGGEYLRLEAEIKVSEASAGFAASEEDRLYNHLFTFFSRYYNDGDFLPQLRRGRQAKYVAPYSGEDVLFYWKSRDSHYVKTTEELRSYAFKARSVRVQFELVEASEDKDNIKGTDRYFIPMTDRAMVSEGKLTVPFAFRGLTANETAKYEKKRGAASKDLQDQIVVDGFRALMDKLPEGADPGVVEYHLRRYVRKNRTDYFVHPKLGPFLRTELDHYLKAEFLDADGFTSPKSLVDQFVKFGALREIGGQIIDFLHQIETLQARLFEKRKFVLRTDYLIPISQLPEELWDESLANEDQLEDWRELFGLKNPITRATIESQPTLVVNTRHFDDAFTHRAISGYDDLDDSVDGVLVNGENYAALRLMGERLRERVALIYCDPPYNTGSDDFVYKDDFSRHSTWLSMMEERLALTLPLLTATGALFVSLDDGEFGNLREALDGVYGEENFVADVIWQSRKSVSSDTLISLAHNHTLFYAGSKVKLDENKSTFRLPLQEEKFANPDDDPRGPWTLDPFDAPNIRPNLTYAIRNPSTGEVHWPPSGRCWRVTEGEYKRLFEDRRMVFGRTGKSKPMLKRYLSEAKVRGRAPTTLWNDLPTTTEGTKLLQHMFGRKGMYTNPKPPELIERMVELATADQDWVIDFFAGSGTTGQAVMRTNQRDGQRRRFVLVEMADYFDSVLVPRIQKAWFSPTWRDGEPTKEGPEGWSDATPRLVRMLRLERYEDSLQSLELPSERGARVAGQADLLGDEFVIRYLLPAETIESKVLLTTEALAEPFSYRLRTHTPDGVREVRVDLVETFNLLMGFHVKRIRYLLDAGRPYRLVEASQRDRSILVVWRSITDLDPKRERRFLEEHLELSKYDRIYVNADSALSGAESLDAEFKRRMLEPDSNFR